MIFTWNVVSIAKAMLSNEVIPLLGPSHFSKHIDSFCLKFNIRKKECLDFVSFIMKLVLQNTINVIHTSQLFLVSIIIYGISLK